eukprot:12836-Heterococcus_DN1.PRE.1
MNIQLTLRRGQEVVPAHCADGGGALLEELLSEPGLAGSLLVELGLDGALVLGLLRAELVVLAELFGLKQRAARTSPLPVLS